jgi:hypothetical protein
VKISTLYVAAANAVLAVFMSVTVTADGPAMRSKNMAHVADPPLLDGPGFAARTKVEPGGEIVNVASL